MNKGFAIPLGIILIIVLILGIGVGGFAYYKYKKEKSIPLEGIVNNNLSATTTSANITQPEESVLDCKGDANCFIQAAQNCRLAKNAGSTTVDILGIKVTTEGFSEIRGMEGSKCLFYMKEGKTKLVFPFDVPQETIDEQNSFYKKLEGSDGVCKFNMPDLVAMLKRWQKGDSSSAEVSCTVTSVSPPKEHCVTTGGDFGVAECSGTYFDIINQNQ